MNFKTILALGAGLLGTAQAFATPITIDFEDFNGTDGFYAQIGDHYSGLGVTFGSDAVALNNNDGSGTQYYPPENHTAGAVMFPTLSGNASLNFAGGFSAASFSYLAATDTQIHVYDGLNGTGNEVYTFFLVANPAWTSVTSAAFSGIGQSIAFGEGLSASAGFDDVSIAPVPLPAAAWLLLSGLGGVGAMARRRRQAVSA